jgi:PAS domain S-box-containing protein
MKTALRILVIEDSEDDALLDIFQIKKGGYDIDYTRIETPEELKTALNEKVWDIVLSDYSMPHFNGLDALVILRESGIDIPFIIISGTIGEEVAVEAMKAGANDYIMKNKLQRLLPAVERELRDSKNRAEQKLLEHKQKLIEEALRESEERYRLIAENTADTITVLDLNLNTIYVSPSIEKLRGYTVHEAMMQSLDQILPPASYQKAMKVFNDQMDLESSKTADPSRSILLELEEFHKNGSIIQVEIAISVIRDNNLNPIQLLLVTRNITQRKQVEEELIIAKEHAEESDRLKTAFLQNMSHEIRTPMNAIMGFSKLMVLEYNNKAKLDEYSQIINNRCSDLLEIINGILDIARIESGQLPVNYDECSLKTVFNELTLFFNEFKLRIEKPHIEFTFQPFCASSDMTIKTDSVKLKQILINLISNAFKFTNTGKIIVGYKLDENQNLIFYVSDTGIGIPADKKGVIFERFTKLNQDKTKFQEGTGLGLAIVKGLIDLLGGKIWLESEPSKGSTFYFSIPYQIIIQPKHLQSASDKAIPKYNFENKTILVVEDDFCNALYIKEILLKLGLTAIHTKYGNEAIDIALKQHIDLVLMDIRLPDITGYEATRRIKLQKKDIKIIAQTAYATNSDKQIALDCGCDDYISKPLNYELLLLLLNEHLKK